MAGPLYEKRFTKHSLQFVPSSEGYIPSSLWPESDNIPTDFQFLADTELNFDPQYEFPHPSLPFWDVLKSPKGDSGTFTVQRDVSFLHYPHRKVNC